MLVLKMDTHALMSPLCWNTSKRHDHKHIVEHIYHSYVRQFWNTSKYSYIMFLCTATLEYIHKLLHSTLTYENIKTHLYTFIWIFHALLILSYMRIQASHAIRLSLEHIMRRLVWCIRNRLTELGSWSRWVHHVHSNWEHYFLSTRGKPTTKSKVVYLNKDNQFAEILSSL